MKVLLSRIGAMLSSSITAVILSSAATTEAFDVQVEDARRDLIVRIGDTNVIAGGDVALPILVTSAADLSQFTFDLEVPGAHVTRVQLTPAEGELRSSAVKALGNGNYELHFEFDPARVQAGTRTVGTLQFTTKADGRSAVVRLGASNLNALRQNGEAIANTSVRGGRIFALENEPILDMETRGTNGPPRLVYYAKPGAQLIIESSSDLRGSTGWTESTGVTMGSNYRIMNLPDDLGSHPFFRVKRLN